MSYNGQHLVKMLHHTINKIALEYEAPVPPRILGEKLYIAGYLYIRRYSYSSESSDPRTRWECDQRRCQASAITSNPDMLHGAKLTVYKGPKESPHVHLPSPINAEESEEIPKYDQRSSRFELDSEKIHGQKSSNTLRRMISAPAKTNDVQVDQMCVKVIGKHLCIDGYIYSRRARGPATSWICKMHWTSGCNVTVSTSDPSLQEELTVYGMDELKNHNHPRNELDVEEAELRAKLDLNKLKRKNFLTNQRLQESKNSGSQNLPQYSLRLCPQTTSAVVTHSKSSFQPQYDVKEGSAVIQKPRRKKNRNRLHDDWAYREFLTEFSKNPKFDQENILRALKMLHSSREGCREDYENVLKNRAKIQRDINALKNNRLKVITAPTLRNVYEKTNTNLRLGTPKESSTTQKHLIRCREKDAAVTSPGSATLLVEKNLLAPLHALSDNDPKTEKELTLIDLTYDSDELEVSKQNPTIVEDMNILSKKTNESIDYREKSFPSGNNVEPDIKPDIYKFSTGFYNNFSFDLRNKIALVPFEVLSDLFNQGSNYQLDSGARNHIYNAPCFGNGLQTPPNVDVPNMRYKGIIPSVVREDMCKNSTPPSTRMVSPMHSSKYV